MFKSSKMCHKGLSEVIYLISFLPFNPLDERENIWTDNTSGKFTSIKRDAFGKTLANPAGNAYNMFTGKPQIGGLGYAFLFRNYRPNLGKWQTSDPLGYPDGWNNLAYVNNKVTRCYDWLGGTLNDGFWEWELWYPPVDTRQPTPATDDTGYVDKGTYYERKITSYNYEYSKTDTGTNIVPGVSKMVIWYYDLYITQTVVTTKYFKVNNAVGPMWGEPTTSVNHNYRRTPGDGYYKNPSGTVTFYYKWAE